MFLYTASYEGRTPEQFLGELEAAGVQLLVDVREVPASRKRGFSSKALAQALKQAGIEYRHIRALGCPKAIRDQMKQDADWEAYTRDFMAHLQQQEPALEELRALVVTYPTALLCYEADFGRCHRSHVARVVAARTGSTVRHITSNGLVTDAAPTP